MCLEECLGKKKKNAWDVGVWRGWGGWARQRVSETAAWGFGGIWSCVESA